MKSYPIPSDATMRRDIIATEFFKLLIRPTDQVTGTPQGAQYSKTAKCASHPTSEKKEKRE